MSKALVNRLRCIRIHLLCHITVVGARPVSVEAVSLGAEDERRQESTINLAETCFRSDSR